MAERGTSVGHSAAQVSQFLRSLTMRQQLLMAGAALVVAGTLFIFVRMMAQPEMRPLYSGMDPQDAQAMATSLAAKNIKYKLSRDGTSVSVEAGQIDNARLETAAQGMPRSGRLGFELFDKPNWGGSDFSEKVNYQRALEGELERTIQTMRGVEAVRVHLVVPPDSVFVDRERAAKASVIIRIRGGGLAAQSQVAIANLVAGAVDKLRPENVSVIDANTNRPINDIQDGEESGFAGKQEDQLAIQLVKTLEPVVGGGRVRVAVHVERDLTSGEEMQESFDPNTTVALTMQRSEERAGGAVAAGVPGTASNVPGAAGSAPVRSGLDDSSQMSKTESGTYAVNKVVRHTVMPAGRLRRISAALLIDDAVDARSSTEMKRRKRTPEELKQIEELARAALGIDSSRGDNISVQNLSFESLPVEAPPSPTVPQRVQTVVQQWSSLLRYFAIFLLFAIVYALFLRPIKGQLLAVLRGLPSQSRLAGANGKAQVESSDHGVIEGESKPTELAKLKSQLTERVKAEPASTSRLLQTWLREGGAS